MRKQSSQPMSHNQYSVYLVPLHYRQCTAASVDGLLSSTSTLQDSSKKHPCNGGAA